MSRYNLKGYDWKKWLKANKDNLRLIASGCAGLAITFLSGLGAPYAVGLGGVVAAVTKLVLDGLDFYLSE